ncbi:gag-pol polyprotein [Gossypium australe]|uniref:Gag-pol polyprotein n=1 Tax=Gossypium australe TaxID=47621 RepID=A0A5B6WQP6_9ROSI|nr:gag-pol polyprotein [Gossypium australe]
MAPLVLNVENYQTWAARMIALDIWKAVGDGYEIPPVLVNPIVAQMNNHKEKNMRKAKSILTITMKFESTIEIWEYLKEKYKGNQKIKNMQVMNLI